MVGRRVINTIDVHAAGELGRVVIDAHLRVRGGTMAERLSYAHDNLDDLRCLLLREPRGYPGACGVLVLPPILQDSDFSIIVMEQGGFRPMSGSNLICAVTALVETGMVSTSAPLTTLQIDTAAGTVRAQAEIVGGRAQSVTFQNVPSFVVALDHPLDLPDYGRVDVDIVFGGQFFVQANAADLGLKLEPGNAREIARAGAVLRTVAEQQFPVQHPEQPEINTIGLVMLHGPTDPAREDAGRNSVVLPNGVVDLHDPATWTGVLDRSPCGTGTCGRMAAKYARGEMNVGGTYSHHSLLGTSFEGSILGSTTVGPYEAILPTITGKGWISAFNRYVLEDDDPFPRGYTVGDIWGPTTGAPSTIGSESETPS